MSLSVSVHVKLVYRIVSYRDVVSGHPDHQLTMLKSTVFNILLVVGVFLAAECRAEQALEDESLHELQDKQDQELQDEDLQDLQDENHPSQDEQEPQDDDDDDGLQNLDDDSDDVAQESQDEQEPSDGRQTYRRTVIRRCFRGSYTLTCPLSYRYRLSCGIQNYARSGSYNRMRYSYPYLSRSCRCYGYRAYCTALCTNKPTTIRVMSSVKTTAGTRNVYCPTGYKVMIYSLLVYWD